MKEEAFAKEIEMMTMMGYSVNELMSPIFSDTKDKRVNDKI